MSWWRHKTLWAVLLFAATAAGCGKSDGDPPISQQAPALRADSQPDVGLMLFALDIGNESKDDGSVAAATRFAPHDKLIASIRTTGQGENVPISARLIAMANGATVTELQRTVTLSAPATTNLQFVKQGDGGWSLGRYLVEVDFGSKRVGQQEIEVAQPPSPNGGQ
ncbi:hypothetical protein AB4084_04545 [Lysobacter sp. 2RAB21]